ncbi:MAG: PqqD family protein [Bacteroidales bacterium]|nr:PqqD family protein [Bacteroidales bacterium]
MRIKKGFVLRRICDQYVITGEGLEQVNFSKLVTLNNTAAFLWQAVEGKDFDPETLADLLFDKYDVTRERALDNARKLCAQWLEMGLIEE